MQSEGIPGPYFPHTNHYSKTCLANTIVGVKLTVGTALEGAKNVAGNVAKTTTGFWGGTARVVERALGWEATAAGLPFVIQALGEECKCDKFR